MASLSLSPQFSSGSNEPSPSPGSSSNGVSFAFGAHTNGTNGMNGTNGHSSPLGDVSPGGRNSNGALWLPPGFPELSPTNFGRGLDHFASLHSDLFAPGASAGGFGTTFEQSSVCAPNSLWCTVRLLYEYNVRTVSEISV